jgi:sugar fermentation stimulation protein A
MKYPLLIKGQLIKRENRFVASVRIDGEKCLAHVPNSGRLVEQSNPGRNIYLIRAENASSRKTGYDWELVELPGGLCSVNANRANHLFQEAVEQGQLPDFLYSNVQPEVKYGSSRIDFRLADGDDVMWVEVKSVSLVENRVGLFPDAPTERGRKHVEELIALSRSGEKTAVVFVALRMDAECVRPHWMIDSVFADSLHKAVENGVLLKAYNCYIDLSQIKVDREIPFEWG